MSLPLRSVKFLLASLAVVATLAAAPITVPRLTHPSAGQIFYFTLTDRFANGSTANDTGGIPGGPDDHGFDPTRISHFHGGDFVGLTARLDYLKNLGVTAVWVTPPFKNKPVQLGTAGYHGYWTLDFMEIDPHLGTNDEYREFIRQAHARGLRVYMDIVVNHTADVIDLQGDRSYRSKSVAPYRDRDGQPFDERNVAFNGLNEATAFPALSAERSFPYQPTVPEKEVAAKNPAWLNDVTLYHNRGNSTFVGENSLHGDFVGLDDLFTERPEVVKGFIDIFSHWIEAYGVDGYRIDTVRHVNAEFWSAFSPAIRARGRALGRPDFLQFGEVANEAGDPAILSEFSTGAIPMDTTLDFGFFAAARKFVSQAGSAAALTDFFIRDDYYTDHDSNVHATTTFLGNHDAGRFGYFLQQDNRGAAPELLAGLVRLGHGLLYLSRGQPVIYYGDEQGMIGRGGNDMQARESVFAAQAPEFRTATLLATTRTGADDKFDEQHPFYALFRRLGALRAAHPALRTGTMIPRPTAEPGLFAFSRIERHERVEYVVALNNSRTTALTGTVPTSQPAGARLVKVFDSRALDPVAGEGDSVEVDAHGHLRLTIAPLHFAVWRAAAPLPHQPRPPQIALTAPSDNAELNFSTRELDGYIFPTRQEIRAEVSGGDGFAEVTFVLARASRPGQFELLGTDDTPPYRVFWRPTADLAPGEKLTFIASVSDLRGQWASAEVGGIKVRANQIAFGIEGATVPQLTSEPPADLTLDGGPAPRLSVSAEGTGPLEYQWIRDDVELPGATSPELRIATPGRYAVLVRNLAGTTISSGTVVSAAAATLGSAE